MRIERKRYVIMRNNRTEIWCGLAKNFYFKKVDEIGDTSVKTYLSEAKARNICKCASWINGSWDRNFEVVPVLEIIDTDVD